MKTRRKRISVEKTTTIKRIADRETNPSRHHEGPISGPLKASNHHGAMVSRAHPSLLEVSFLESKCNFLVTGEKPPDQSTQVKSPPVTS